VLRFLGDDATPAQILEWEGYAARLSPPGKLIAPRMLELGYSQKTLAQKAGIDEETLEGVLCGTTYPEPKTLKQLATTLGIGWQVMRRARQQLPKPSPPPYVQRLFRRRGRHQGRTDLQRLGHRLGSGYRDGQWKKKDGTITRITADDRKDRSQAALKALNEYWASATDADCERWGVLHLEPQPEGLFGLCRVCGTLTHRPGRSGQVSEYHAICLAKWRSESEGFVSWGKQNWERQLSTITAKTKQTTPPIPSYPAHKRLTKEELADYYMATVLYIHVKLGRSVA
jgi:transcriptional regulator with XRE-family HTH domain